jgi:hypothetical protein
MPVMNEHQWSTDALHDDIAMYTGFHNHRSDLHSRNIVTATPRQPGNIASSCSNKLTHKGIVLKEEIVQSLQHLSLQRAVTTEHLHSAYGSSV